MNNQGSMQSDGSRAGAGSASGGHGLPWLAIGGGLVAALALGLLVLAWQLGGPRRADWIEQPIAAPTKAPTPGANSGTKP